MNQDGLLHTYIKKLKKMKDDNSFSKTEGPSRKKFCIVCGSQEKLHSLSRSMGLIEIVCSECLPYLPTKSEIEEVSPELFTRPPKDINV